MDASRVPAGTPVLAVSSSGENWAQLLLLTQRFAPADLTFAAPLPPGDEPPAGSSFVPIRDFRLFAPAGVWTTLFRLLGLMRRQRFGMILTTGAAPGAIAVVLGRLFGIRTVWVESIENARDMSLSGKFAGRFATHWLTQWPHLARPNGPTFLGNVL